MADEGSSFPMAVATAEPHYPILNFFDKYGHAVAILTALAVLAATFGTGGALSWGWVVGGVVGAALAYLVLRCFAEIAHLLIDTLIPK